MASNNPKMKVDVEADTSKFSKGMKQAKADLRDLDKTSSSALHGIGDAIGVDTDKLNLMAGSLRGLGAKMTEMGGEGTKAFGKLLAGIDSLAVGIAGLGIGAAVVSFKALTAEAENFKTTVEGANLQLMTSAYIDTYRQALHDMNKDTAKEVATLGEQLKQMWGRVTAGAGQGVMNALTGKGSTTVASLFGPIGALLDVTGVTDKNLRSQMDQANAAGTRAAEIADRMYQLERQRSDQTRQIAELDAQIAAYKKDAYDTTLSITEQSQALAKVQELIKEKYALQLPIEREMSALMDEMNSLASSTPEQIDAANKQSVIALNLEKQRDEELKSLSRRQSTINNQLAKQSAELAKAAAEAAKIAQSRADLAGLDLSVSDQAKNILSGVQATFNDNAGIIIPVKLDEASVIDLTNELQALVTDAAASVGEALGGLIGDLATGGDAWTNFANTAMSAFGDMAISVGKLAIATGTATLGIKAALESLNGGVAIAAGTALVMLGYAVKAGLSNIAGGNYNASTSVASSAAGSTYAASGYDTRSINVNVSGTLEGNGDKLVAVINQANKKKNYRT